MVGKRCCSLVFVLTRPTCNKTRTITNTHPTRQLHNKHTKTPYMDRTFHQRLSPATSCGILAFGLLALYMFWIKSVLAGCLLATVVIVIIERIVHTTYVFSNDGEEEMLYIDNGRFSKTRQIRVNDIVLCRKMSTGFGLSQYVLLQCGHKRLVSVQPDNADAFIAEVKKRQVTPK